MKDFLTGTIQDLMPKQIFFSLVGRLLLTSENMLHVKILEHISSSNISKFLVKIWSGLKE